MWIRSLTYIYDNLLNVLKLIFLVVFLFPVTLTANEPITAIDVKAAYLFQFTRFIEWPMLKNEPINEKFIFCVLGKDPITKLLQPLSQLKVEQHPIAVKAIKATDDISSCEILYIALSEKANLNKILKQVQKNSILTVSSIPEFSHNGGMINFIIAEKKVRIVVNLFTARKAKLKISAKLLEISINVIQKSPDQEDL
ncbi:MAG: YfiR family protein [Thiohalomonadales bacterium]